MINEIEPNYVRVGKVLYKCSNQPLSDNKFKSVLIPWSINLYRIEVENWREKYSKISKYDNFCCVPEHLNYKRDINGYYNRYEPLKIQPLQGNCENIICFIQHVFGEQFEFGMDYLTILYRFPKQVLPILALVSKITNSGKTTFLNLLKVIYGNNMSILSNEDFSSNFNSSWAFNSIVGIEEVHLKDKSESEKIKNASTAKFFNMEAKGQDRVEIEFFGKFILVSNHENDFIYIAPDETRFWVRKLPVIRDKNPDFLSFIEKEIPAFLCLLKNRRLAVEKKQSRMWFSPEQIETEQLLKVKSFFANPIKCDILEIAEEICEMVDIKELKFSNSDMMKLLKNNGVNVKRMQLKIILEEDFGLRHSGNAFQYEAYLIDSNGIPYMVLKKGKFYTLSFS